MDVGDLTEVRGPDFQTVIIIDHDDGRMFPLTETTPKCLLPVANRPILSYQLDALRKCRATGWLIPKVISESLGDKLLTKLCSTNSSLSIYIYHFLLEIYIVAPIDYSSQLTQFLQSYITEVGVSIELVTVAKMNGSADCLRAVSDRIRGDFIVVSGDIITDFSLGSLVHLHRLKTADVTVALCSAAHDESDRKGGVKRVIDEEDQEYIGTDVDGRLLFKMSALELDGGAGGVTLHKSLLHRAGQQLTLRNNTTDSGIYVMSWWIIEFLMECRRISSIRSDLIPFLIKRQFQPDVELLATVPGLRHRNRPLASLESWLAKNNIRDYNSRSDELSEHLMSVSSFISNASNPSLLMQRSASEHAVDDSFVSTGQLSSSGANVTGSASSASCSTDMLKCYSLFVDPVVSNETPSHAQSSVPFVSVCRRITNLQTYMNINRFY